MRLVSNGPMVACSITHLDGLWQASINGEAMPPHEDPAAAKAVERIWTRAERIPQFEHDYLLAVAQTAPAGHPARTPDQPIDRMAMAPVAIPKRGKHA